LRTRSAWALPVLACLFGAAPDGAAQERRQSLERLEDGDSVRLRLPGALKVDASMRDLRDDTLVLIVSGLATDWSLSAYDLETLERWVDRSPSEGFRHGAAIGFAIGLIAGAAAGGVLNATSVLGDPSDPASRVVDAAIKWGAFGGGLGMFGGGFLGGARPGRGWISIELPVLR
jgi:hypothetical protein